MISHLIADIDGEIQVRSGDGERKVALIAEMFMALAGGATDAMTIRAKHTAYSVGLEEIPAWVLKEALDQWYGAKVKALAVKSDEYRWPPAPGVLAIICRSILQPYRDALDDLNTVLTVKPLDETLKLLHQRGAA